MSNATLNLVSGCVVLGFIVLVTSGHRPVAASEQLPPENICSDKYEGFAGFITEADTGKTFSYKETSRFGICLSEKQYPLKDLDTSDCDSIMGYVSNWSLRGPNNYPIGFEITGIGSCVVRNGAFRVRIVGTKLE